MSKVEFFATPAYSDRNLEKFHYSQAVKVGNRVEISGAGASWRDVIPGQMAFARMLAAA